MDFVIRNDFLILVVFITTFRPSDPPAFFRCISNSGIIVLEFRTQPFIATEVPCSHSSKECYCLMLSSILGKGSGSDKQWQ